MLSSRCRLCHNAQQRAYKRQHRAAQTASAADWRNRNPDRVKAAEKRWIDSHPYSQREIVMRRNAIAAGVHVERISYAAILERDGWNCHICGGAVNEVTLSFDHVIPIVKGGPHISDNVRVAHLSCNFKKWTSIL